MNVHFFDNSEANGHLAPREEVKIERLEVTPYPDRYRIFIEVDVTPFAERPNLLLVAHDDNDHIVGELNVIGTMHPKMEFTMHIRGQDDPAGVYTLTAELFYETRNPPQDHQMVAFTIPQVDTP